MKRRERDIGQLIASAQRFINENNLDMTVEQLYVEFERMLKTYTEFTEEINSNPKTKIMYRSQEKLQRRELFINWYLQKHRDKRIKTVLHELSGLLFTSPKTIEKQLF